MPLLEKDFPKARYLFLTLTVRNCKIDELRSQIDILNNAFRKLSRRKNFPAVGWLKSLEVTRGKDGSAHPHLHVLMMVKPSYFSHGYLSQKEWGKLWKSCLKVDYQPVIHVKAIKPKKSPTVILNEVIKYQTKESDLIADPAWFAEYVNQMHNTRAIALGGIFRDYFKALEEEPEDLIGKDEEEDLDSDSVHLFFSWRKNDRKYRLIDSS